jgi:hypothetical protein
MNGYLFAAFARHMTTLLLRREFFSIVAARAARLAGGTHSTIRVPPGRIVCGNICCFP